MKDYVVGVGGANMDMHACSCGAVIMRDSNPCRMHSSPGGVTRNILENLARQGVACSLISAVGRDAFGDRILSCCREAGVDVSNVFISPGMPSSCYFDLTDQSGDMLLGASDLRVLEALPADYITQRAALLRGAAAIVCDTNLSTEMLEALIDGAGPAAKIFLDPVSTTKAKKIRSLLGRLYLIKPNLIELEELCGISCTSADKLRAAVDRLLETGLESIVVSLGSRGCYYADRQGRQMFRSLRPVEVMANATGAGDAFTAGLIHGFCCGEAPEEFLDYALASGILAVQSAETINPLMSDALVRQTIIEYKR